MSRLLVVTLLAAFLCTIQFFSFSKWLKESSSRALRKDSAEEDVIGQSIVAQERVLAKNVNKRAEPSLPQQRSVIGSADYDRTLEMNINNRDMYKPPDLLRVGNIENAAIEDKPIHVLPKFSFLEQAQKYYKEAQYGAAPQVQPIVVKATEKEEESSDKVSVEKFSFLQAAQNNYKKEHALSDRPEKVIEEKEVPAEEKKVAEEKPVPEKNEKERIGANSEELTPKERVNEVENSFVIHKNRKLGLVHVGKTGGTTVERIIKFHADDAGENQVSRQVEEIFHCKQPDVDKYDSYIVSTRNPVDRLISWFFYAHPKNELRQNYISQDVDLYNCYEQLADFATHGLSRSKDDTLKTPEGQACQEVAQNIVKGKPERVKYFGNYLHAVRNYRYYTEELLNKPEKEIFVARTENFWNDWQKINRLIGGTNIKEIKSVTHRERRQLKVFDKTMRSIGQRNLCFFLCPEIQLYKKLINRAVNLEFYEKRKSLAELDKSCPREARGNKCHHSTLL